MPFHGLQGPLKSCGKRVGRITVSCRASLAAFKPATSSHLMLGFSVMMAPSRPFRNRSFSLSSASCSAEPPVAGGGGATAVASGLVRWGAWRGAGAAPEESWVFNLSATSTSSSRRSRTISLTLGLLSHRYTNLKTSRAFLYSLKASWRLPLASSSRAFFARLAACERRSPLSASDICNRRGQPRRAPRACGRLPPFWGGGVQK
mmetsp:Transcript_11629/g.36109  ORF Transcript_11629/g.36109 Transcript_11629/m.36109 type:complete len:204 (+) Transcript_11629:922-1533(+)